MTEYHAIPKTPVVERYQLEGLAPTAKNAKPSSAQHGEALVGYLKTLIRASGDDADFVTQGTGWRYVSADEMTASEQPLPPEGWGVIIAEVATVDDKDVDIEVEPDTFEEEMAEAIEDAMDEGLFEMTEEDAARYADVEERRAGHHQCTPPNPLGRIVSAIWTCPECDDDWTLVRPDPASIRAEWKRDE